MYRYRHNLQYFRTRSLKFSQLLLLFSGLIFHSFTFAEQQEADPVLTEVETENARPESAKTTDLFSRDTYRIDKAICPFKGSLDYEPGTIECGLLQVPENRENPESRYIELSFIKLNSTWDADKEAEKDEEDRSKLPPGKREDPVIYLTGGPGAKALGYVKRFKNHGIRTHRDLYILEQRGIGHSSDFCLQYGNRQPDLNNAASQEEQFAANITRQNNCSANALAAGVDLNGYNTIENARDVKALRRALGFDQWNLWGISYGTIVGQAYINEDPEGIRAIILDAISPLNARENIETWFIASWYDRDLKKLDALCQADENCAAQYPELGKKVREAILSVSDNPIQVDVKDTEIYPSGKASFFGDSAGFLPFGLFYEQSNYAALPAVIYAWSERVINRDEDFFSALAQMNDLSGYSSSQGMYDSVLCVDGEIEAFANSLKKDLENHPVLASALTSSKALEVQRERCEKAGMTVRGEGQYRLPQTDIPALLVEGDMDPITPPPLAKIIEPGFSNGTYVEFPYAGHGPSRSVECAGEMMNKFYDNPEQKPDLSCVDEMEKPEFIAPIFKTNIVPRLMLKMAEDKKSLAGPAVWACLSIMIVLVSFIVLTLGAIGRKIDDREAVDVGRARLYAWLAATISVIALGIMAAAFGASFQSSEILVVFGLVPWAKYGAFLILLAGLLGFATTGLILYKRKETDLPIGSLTGLLLTGLGSISLMVFFVYWDLSLF